MTFLAMQTTQSYPPDMNIIKDGSDYRPILRVFHRQFRCLHQSPLIAKDLIILFDKQQAQVSISVERVILSSL